jgi:hypothetical protein
MPTTALELQLGIAHVCIQRGIARDGAEKWVRKRRIYIQLLLEVVTGSVSDIIQTPIALSVMMPLP